MSVIIKDDVDPSKHRLLTVFKSVCQALAYAHSRGVVHLDVKPMNIMVGAFGEVMLMDWGLARCLTKPMHGEDESFAGVSFGGRELTEDHHRPGCPFGTPAYASPEQANGRHHEITTRSDVFGLGATLCETLTGRPPFAESKHSGDIWDQAASADLTGAFRRLDSCGGSPELVGLAKWCMSPLPNHRPDSAREVLEAIERFEAEYRQELFQRTLALREQVDGGGIGSVTNRTGAVAGANKYSSRMKRMLAGVGSVLSLFPDPDYSPQYSDSEAIMNDWLAIGHDLASVAHPNH